MGNCGAVAAANCPALAPLEPWTSLDLSGPVWIAGRGPPAFYTPLARRRAATPSRTRGGEGEGLKTGAEQNCNWGSRSSAGGVPLHTSSGTPAPSRCTRTRVSPGWVREGREHPERGKGPGQADPAEPRLISAVIISALQHNRNSHLKTKKQTKSIPGWCIESMWHWHPSWISSCLRCPPP